MAIDSPLYRDTGDAADYLSEFAAATTGAGVHDASYYGRLKATGEDALDLLNRLSTNKVDHLLPGHWAPTVLTSDRGRIVDLLLVVNAGDCVYLVTSPGQQQPVIDWLDKYTIMEDLTVEDVSAGTAMLALTGPAAPSILGLEDTVGGYIPGEQLPAPEVSVKECSFLAISHRRGDLPVYFLLGEQVAAAWQPLLEQGARPIGEQAWQALRISLGTPEFGPEMGEPYNPLEAGLIGSIDFTKGCYIGQEVIARLDSYSKVQKYLVKLKFTEGSVFGPGDSLVKEGRAVGTVTSVSEAPGKGWVGLGFVRTSAAMAGQELELQAPGRGRAIVGGHAQLFGPGQDFS